MKKVLISLMLVLLTLCLVVSCNPAPKEGYEITVATLGDFTVACGENDTWAEVFEEDGSITIDGQEYTINITTGCPEISLKLDGDFKGVFQCDGEDVLPSSPVSDYAGKTLTLDCSPR